MAEADSWIAQGHNLLAFGPPGAGKTHLLAGIGHALIGRGDLAQERAVLPPVYDLRRLSESRLCPFGDRLHLVRQVLCEGLAAVCQLR